MDDISVVVNQTVGSISWNFDDISNRLGIILKAYTGTIVTDDTISAAKKDVASLRGLAKDIDDRRKEVKAKCLEPYNVIDAQAKELIALIDEPIKAINAQLDAYETKRKDAVKARIDAYWDMASMKLPTDVVSVAYGRIYDSRWLNATTTVKTWKDGIDSGIAQILADIDTIKSFNSEFEADMMSDYKDACNLQAAILKMNNLNAQKARVLEIERKKAEEKARIEAEAKARQEIPAEPVKAEPTAPVAGSAANDNPDITDPFAAAPSGVVSETIVITAKPEVLAKIKGYIKYVGAEWRSC